MRVGPRRDDDPAMRKSTRSYQPTTSVYLVERFWPGVTPALADAATVRLERAASRLNDQGAVVRHLRSALLPADEVVMSLVEAGSLAIVVAVNERADYPADRISRSIPVGQPRQRRAR